MLAGAACGTPAIAPAAKLAQLATSSQQAPKTIVQASASDSAASPTAGAVPPTDAAQLSSSGTAAPAGEVALALKGGNAKAEYQTQEQLAGKSLPNVAVGATSGVSGQIVLTRDGQLDAAASKITVDLTSLKSDESMRDAFVQRNTLQTSQYPQAVFEPTAVSGLTSLPTSGAATFQMAGNLTVHGVTKPITWTVTADFNGQQASGKATAPFTITEFGMSLPKAGPVLSVQDAGALELDFTNVALTSAG